MLPYSNWGTIPWFPRTARFYGRCFRWLFTRWTRPPMRIYRPMAFLYNHWHD